MNFLFPFLSIVQPGALWIDLAPYRPSIVLGVLALIVGLRRHCEYPRKDAFRHPLYKYIWFFLIAQVLSVRYGGLGAMVDEIVAWIGFLTFPLVALALLTDVNSLRKFVWGMIAGGIFIALYGIYALVFHIGFAAVGRAGAYGMYENHNDYTFIIHQVFPFVYIYSRFETSTWKRMFLYVSLLICVLGILLSLSRGGILALLLESLLIIIFAMTNPRRWLLIPVLAVVGAGAIGYQWAKRAENSTTYTAADAESSRYELWRAAQNMIVAKPLLGVGSRRFPEYSREYGELSHDNIGKNSHNTFLEILATSGFLGFIPFVLLSWGVIREMRVRPPPNTPEIIEATGKAVLIAYVTVLFRGMFDAKTYDWSYYTLAVLAIGCVMLRGTGEEETVEATYTPPPYPIRTAGTGYGR